MNDQLTILHGDCRETLKTLDAGSVQCVVTSPPYFGLRDYGSARWDGGDAACDHIAGLDKPRSARPLGNFHGGDDKFHATPYRDTCGKCGAVRIDQQIGLEQTPTEYVAALVAVFAEIWRVLRDDGTVWLNLGDSYAGSRPSPGRNDTKTMYRNEAAPSKQSNNFGKQPQCVTCGRFKRYVSGAWVCNHEPKEYKPKDLIGIPWRVAFALQDAGWYLRSDIIWAKPNCMPESVTDRPTRSHEYLFLLTKRERYYYDADAIREPYHPNSESRYKYKFGGEGYNSPTKNPAAHIDAVIDQNPAGRNRRTVWTISTKPFSGSHFAVFPEALVEPCILAGSRVGDTVLDPFGGSGTAARVALRYQRRAILCELNADYLTLQEERTNGVQVSLLAGVL